MKLKIEKLDAGKVRVTLTTDARKEPLVVEAEQLDLLLAMIDTAKRAGRFDVEFEVDD